MIERHFCFCTHTPDYYEGRIHVPLAQKCSLNCVYCNYSKTGNISKTSIQPGTSSSCEQTFDQIYEYLKKNFQEYPETSIIGVSGPGDPLENLSALYALVDVMNLYYQNCCLCLCTNGRVWNSNIKDFLSYAPLKYITLTINTSDKRKYPLIYNSYKTLEDIDNLWDHQINIIKQCVKLGIKVKVNTVYLNGINNDELENLYYKLLNEGVSCFNLLPVVGAQNLQHYNIGYKDMLTILQQKSFPMMRNCQQCRSDHCEHRHKVG